jgi:hypothetical protein
MSDQPIPCTKDEMIRFEVNRLVSDSRKLSDMNSPDLFYLLRDCNENDQIRILRKLDFSKLSRIRNICNIDSLSILINRELSE